MADLIVSSDIDTFMASANAAGARSALGLSTVAATGAYNDLSGKPTLAASATTDTTNASNITSGTLPDARLSANVVVAGRTTFDRANVTVGATARYVAQTGAFTPGTDTPGARTVTLPDATTFGVGRRLTVADESGTVRPWYRLVLTPASGQWLGGVTDGTYPLVWGSQSVELFCTGTGWQVVNDSVRPTIDASEQRTYPSAMICLEQELNLMSGNGVQPGLRVFSASTTANGAGSNTSLGLVRVTSGSSPGTSFSSVVTVNNSQGGVTQANRRGQWCEMLIDSMILPDATNDAVFRLGFGDSTAFTEHANGAYFAVERAISTTPNWVIVSGNNSARTKTDSTIAVNTGQTRLGVELNDTQTAAWFFINDTYVGSITTNIPSSARLLNVMVGAHQITGSGARSYDADRIRHQFRAVISRNY